MKQRYVGFAVILFAAALKGDRQSASMQCVDTYGRGDYLAALSVCDAEFTATRHPQSGITAARAAFRLERYDEVLLWPQRLAGTPEEPAAWLVTGAVHNQLHQGTRAKHAYLAALELYRAAGDAKHAADCLYRLFYLSWRASEHRDAFVFAMQAFEEAARAHDASRQVLALEGLFTSLYEIGDLDAAARVVDKLDGLVSADDRVTRSRLALHRGAVLMGQSMPAAARRAFNDALRLGDAGNADFALPVHFNLVESDLLLGDLNGADDHLRATQQIAAAVRADQNHAAALAFYGSWLDYERGRFDEAARRVTVALNEATIPDWRWVLQFRLGKAEQARGRSAAAEDAYQKAVDGLEDLRAAVGNDEFKDWLIHRRRQPFESLFLLKVARHDYRGALNVVEHATARAFYDAFVQNVAASATHDKASSWNVDDAAARFESLRDFMPAPVESAIVPLPTLTTLLDAVGSRQVLVYFQAEDQLWLLTVARGGVAARPLGEAREIGRLAERFIGRPDDRDLADQLGRVLLPEAVLPPDDSTLYIVPDRALGGLPFAALRVKGRWVAEHWTVSYLPSVSSLSALESVTAAWRGPAVVIGDPRGDLPDARVEAERVAEGLGVAAHTGAAATRSILSHASDARLLHVAAHSWLAPGGPWIGLADGRINTSAVFRERIRPRRVVLASCSGAVTRGGGYWGSWSAAFLAAGTQSVVASLWSVGDVQSREFVLRFYAAGGADAPMDALADTQRAFIRAQRPPSFWASFVHMGVNGNGS